MGAIKQLLEAGAFDEEAQPAGMYGDQFPPLAGERIQDKIGALARPGQHAANQLGGLVEIGKRRIDPQRDLTEDIARAMLVVERVKAREEEEAAEVLAVPEILLRRFTDVGLRVESKATGGVMVLERGLNPTELVVLQLLLLHRMRTTKIARVTMAWLAEKMGSTTRNVRSNLQRLERAKLVDRISNRGAENDYDLSGLYAELDRLREEEKFLAEIARIAEGP